MTVQREGHARALHRRGICGIGRGKKQSGRVRHLFDAFAAHIETADLISRAETVFHRAQHTQCGFGVALELADHINQMFQRAWAGNRPVFGDMADQQYRNIKRFGGVDQRARHFAHLSRASGDAIDFLRDDGLRGIDDGQRRLALFDKPQRG